MKEMCSNNGMIRGTERPSRVSTSSGWLCSSHHQEPLSFGENILYDYNKNIIMMILSNNDHDTDYHDSTHHQEPLSSGIIIIIISKIMRENTCGDFIKVELENLDCARRIKDKYVMMKILWNYKILWKYCDDIDWSLQVCGHIVPEKGRQLANTGFNTCHTKLHKMARNSKKWQLTKNCTNWHMGLKTEIGKHISLRKGNDPECKIGHNMFISFAYN